MRILVFIVFNMSKQMFLVKNDDEHRAKIVWKTVPRSIVVNYNSLQYVMYNNILQSERRRKRSKTDVRLY